MEAITTNPTSLNSALVVRKIAVKRREAKIQIQVVTCVADNKHSSAARGVSLAKMPESTYQLEYPNHDGTGEHCDSMKCGVVSAAAKRFETAAAKARTLCAILNLKP